MIIDILFALLVLMAIVKGYRNGLVVAIFSVIALMVGLAAAIKLSIVVSAWLNHSMHISSKWLPIISFILVFLVVMLLVRFAAAAIQGTMELVMLGWVNRLGGIILYVLLYTVIFSVLLFYCDKVHILTLETISESRTYHVTQPLGPKAIDTIGRVVPFFKNMFHELETFFGTIGANKM